jgi:predicted ATPase
MTRLLLEGGEAGGLQAIPPTLQQSLAARLDRLGDAREVAQIGAVLGRDFTYALLAAVAAVDDQGLPPPPRSRAVPLPRSAGEDAPNGAASFLPRPAGEGDHAKHGGGGYSEAALQSALDRLVGSDLLYVEGANPQANYRFKHALIQDAAYDSLLKSRRQALHRRAAEVLRDEPERAAAEPEVIAHHFTEAGLDDLAIEWWGRAGDQALRRSAFQEAIAHLGKAIAMADKAEGAAAQQGTGDTAPSSRQSKLQTDYSQAVMWLKGFAAEETKAAFGRAAELVERSGTGAELYRVYQGQWDGSWFHGELILARKLAESFVHEAEAKGHEMEAAVAHRTLGQTCVTQGELALARNYLERALALQVPGRDIDERRAFGTDTRTVATAFLGWSTWLLGEIELARRLIDQVVREGCASDHAATMAQAYTHLATLEAFRDDPAATQRASEAAVGFSRMHDLALFAGFGEILSSWARGHLVDPRAGARELREALEAWLKQGNRIFSPWVHGLIAELQATAGHVDEALATVDQGLALAEETGEHWKDPLLFRRKGEILLRRDPANTAPAEEAFQRAIAIAKLQGSRSYGLRAALALAKLYQSNARPADAHAVLAPALEGFSPTPEMLEIAEAQALLAALADSDEVKSAATARQRRLQLQTRYGQAMMYSRGFASDESKTAFARARTLAAGVGDASERFDAYYGLFVGSLMRGELSLARETAESFLREAENEGRTTEAAAARRNVGQARLWQGDFIGAGANLAEALRTYDAERDRDARLRFGPDTGAGAACYLALASWALGDVERARALSDEALARADETGHAPTRANVYDIISRYHMLRSHPETVMRTAQIPLDLGRGHAMALYLAYGEMDSNWARAWLGDRKRGMTGLREALAAYLGQGNKLFVPLFQGRLAELEAEGNDADGPLRRIDEALALANETGEHWTDAPLHRMRGAILLKRDSTNPAPAVEAFLAAITIAQAQKARSFELQPALALAKRYQSTGSPADARAVLAQALEGFAPTPEMPEIAEAQALLEQL